MVESKQPKVRFGRISRALKLPCGFHKKIKELARSNSMSASKLYDHIIEGFVEGNHSKKIRVEYLHPQGELERVNISFKEEVVINLLKRLSVIDAVPENRIIYTAIVRFIGSLSD